MREGLFLDRAAALPFDAVLTYIETLGSRSESILTGELSYRASNHLLNLHPFGVETRGFDCVIFEGRGSKIISTWIPLESDLSKKINSRTANRLKMGIDL